ncbi:MAG TPA: tetratricopeptide repeat protein, partial [Longimicrobiales bacterium]|nr:tetratricopeptide repeat protein [Longimicrobiales bacterium]
MSPPNPPPADDPLRVDGILEILPRIPELRPVLDLLVSASRPDPERRWTGSGELGTVGDRIVQSAEVARGAAERAEAEAGRIGALFRRMAELVEALAAKRREDAVSILLEQGESEESADRPGDAEAWYRAAHALSRRIGSPRSPEALRRAARAARSGGRLGEAARDYEEAWREAELLDRREDRIVAAIGRGNVAVDRGRWDEAERWYDRAGELADGDGSLRRERWQILQNLAIVHRRRGELDAAREALDGAERETRDLDDPDAVVEVG